MRPAGGRELPAGMEIGAKAASCQGVGKWTALVHAIVLVVIVSKSKIVMRAQPVINSGV